MGGEGAQRRREHRLLADIDPPVFVGRQRAAACTLEELAEQGLEDTARRRPIPFRIEPTQPGASVCKEALGGFSGRRARPVEECMLEGEGRLTTAARPKLPRRKLEEMLVQGSQLSVLEQQARFKSQAPRRQEPQHPWVLAGHEQG